MGWFVPALLALAALLVVPIGAHPFSAPKLAVLCAGALLAGVVALRGRARGPRWMALLWLGLALMPGDPEAQLLDAAAALLLAGLLSFEWDTERALRAIAWIGAILSLVVIAQWLLPGPRLRMYGTLGNPDFCAAWITASLCAAIAKDKRLAVVQAIALACIGSFATLLALGVAALFLSRSRAAIGATALLCVAAAGRDPVRVAQGRIELHRIAAPHLLDAPLTGLGAGSVKALWPSWDPAGRPQDHAHDDWLERAIERGIPSMLLLAALAALAIVRARKKLPAAAAGIAAIAARAFVDFPLARPAELTLFVVLIAMPWQED